MQPSPNECSVNHPYLERAMSAHRDLLHPRDEIMRTMERIYRYRMTTTSGGNLSILDENGDVWITPARVDKGNLRRDDVMRVRPNGAVEGLHRPSSEFPFHRAIYAARPDLRAIVHAHPVALVAFSICRQVPDTQLLPQARQVCGEIGFAPYALPGSEALGSHIASSFAAGFDCVVLENHGVVTGGASLQQAFERFETLEFTAKSIVKASLLGPVRYLSDEDARRPRPAPRASSASEPSGVAAAPRLATSRERELRRQLCEFVRRSYQQRLMISTQGAFSARLDPDSFLITPRGVDRSALDVHDIVLVRRGVAESGRAPSSATLNHGAIYERHPQIQAIVTAYPVNATAFSVTDEALDTRTIPESYIFLRMVGRAPYGVQFEDGRRLADLTSPRNPILLLENDGVQVCGTSILDAFDRLEVLESTAEAMINSRPLGDMVPMSDETIRELDEAFLPEA
jgi:L-fuculose-phosphate aldolase